MEKAEKRRRDIGERVEDRGATCCVQQRAGLFECLLGGVELHDDAGDIIDHLLQTRQGRAQREEDE